jgi:hypothetical protein
MRLDEGQDFVHEIGRKARGIGLISGLVSPTGVARVPVDPEPVDAGRGAIAPRNGAAVGCDEDEIQSRTRDPVSGIGVVPRIGHAVRIDRRARVDGSHPG